MELNIQMFATGTTVIADLIDPQVMAPMVSAKIDNAIVVTPFAKIDTTLVGVPGDTITVPKYAYVGDASDVDEGILADATKLSSSSAPYKVKKAVKAVTLTDEAVLSGYGNPVGETNNQLGLSIASKIDADAITVLQTAGLSKDNSSAYISYDGIVDTIDLFDEEVNTDKVMFINPKQVTTLRKDADFISADKYNNNVIMRGEIGMIANARIVPSRRIVETAGVYNCPIMQLNSEVQTEDETPALTIFMKRDTNVETERHSLAHTTDVVADKHYVCALTNENKVVIGKFKADTAASL